MRFGKVKFLNYENIFDMSMYGSKTRRSKVVGYPVFWGFSNRGVCVSPPKLIGLWSKKTPAIPIVLLAKACSLRNQADGSSLFVFIRASGDVRGAFYNDQLPGCKKLYAYKKLA